MRTGPAASRDVFERPPWQGWELSPTNSALGSEVQRFAHRPTAQRQGLSPSTRPLPLPFRPSPRAPACQVVGRPRLSQAGPALHPQPSANTPPPAASGARAGPALARRDQLRERPGHRRLQPMREVPCKSQRTRQGTPWGPRNPALPLAPGSQGRGLVAGAGGWPRSLPAPSRRKAPRTAISQTLARYSWSG